ncbi:MAG: aminopeptidase P family protein [Lachnospiraceae bacterium]
MVKERLKQLREEMKKRGIDIYVVPTSDFHESEYVGEYFKARRFISGFTGSAGTAVITMDEAGLWTDGRYFLQAAAQLEGSTVTLFRMGEEGVPTVGEYMKKSLKKGGCIGFDGRVVNTQSGETYKKIAEEKEGTVYAKEDLIDLIWQDRPQLPKEPIFVLEEKYAGESTQSKLKRVRAEMEKAKANTHILTCLYDIAWLLNIRGNDIACVPVVLSFVVVTKSECYLFLNSEVLTTDTRKYLEDNQVTIKDYEEIYSFVSTLHKEDRVMLHKAEANFNITSALQKGIEIVDCPNPSTKMKSIKNDIEIKNTIAAHVKDGVAFTKFMYWLKTNIGKIPMDELMASDYLEGCRRAQDHFLELSFDTICAYGPNAAMMHYQAKPEAFAELKPEGFLLVDSGGHYYEGTTDITRTMALGPISQEQRLHFTTVVRACMGLGAAKFLHGCSGQNLDILARGPMWDMGLDYKCGTGHGVGYLLNVHEGPQGFRWRIVAERNDSAVLEAGSITTDEPGIYLDGKYGIRIENELVCREAEKNEYGQFMNFETITFAPIDLDAIDVEELTKTEKKRLNEYHAMVYNTISPYMTAEENEWLKQYTRAI